MSITKDLFIFAIPMMPKHRTNNWQNVLDNLQATLHSILNQTDQNFLALIAASDEIELPEISHPLVQVIAIPEILNEKTDLTFYQKGIRDAGRKRWYLTVAAKSQDARYFFPIDSDDLVSSKLVETVRKIRHPVGYAITSGYILDCTTGRVIDCPDQSVREDSYDKHSGSSIIYTLGEAEQPISDWPGELITAGHQNARAKMINLGKPFMDLTEKMGIYVVNTGNNMSSFADNIDGSKSFTAQSIEKIKQQDAALTRAQLLEFGLLFDNSNLL